MMPVTQQLREAARSIWDSCLKHPFVTGIGDASLPLEKFQFFLLQDYLYLFSYAKVFALGVAKADSPELMRLFSSNVQTILHGEMNIHRSYMSRLGISEEQVAAVQPSLANLSYTNYMISIAYAGGPVEILDAILACSWSYAVIGQELAKRPSAQHPLFGEWIQSYASDAYAQTNQVLLDWIDRLTQNCSEEKYARLEDIFCTCSRYELGFWQMAWKMAS